VDRRTALATVLAGGALGAAALLAACGRTSGAEPPQRSTNMSKGSTPADGTSMPSIFLAHGSPLLLDDALWVSELAGWARAMPKPKAILMVSAHWIDAPVALGATTSVPLVYDFYGFPAKYSQVKYAAPGAPALGERVRALVSPSQPVVDAPTRGLDHGAYVPLVAMYPEADVPVLQLSIPTMEPAPLIALGRALAPLRREGVLIVGSGFLTHNMRAIEWRPGTKAPSWASEFDAWTAEVLAKRDVDALANYREIGPGVRTALPTVEHFVPVLLSLGTSLDREEAATFPIAGFTYGSFTKRSVQFG
jgi:4,5-DOPA dioxygenase extradiol